MDGFIESPAVEQLEQPMRKAPKDGTVVLLPLSFNVRAYWCRSLKTWVLVQPLHIESIIEPSGWIPESK